MSDDDFDRKLGERIRETRDESSSAEQSGDLDDAGELDSSAGTGGTSDTSGAGGTDNTQNANSSGGSHGTGDTDGSDASTATTTTDDAVPVRDRPQTVLYLPEDLRDALQDRYNRLDGMDKMNGGDGIAKHDEFYAGVVRAALDHPDLADFVGVTTGDDDA